MNRFNKMPLCNNRGFTLLEVVLVVPIIAIVFALGYNMLFLTQESFSSVRQSFDVTEQLRNFQTNIFKEANQAKQVGDEANRHSIYKNGDTSIYLYADVDNADGKNIPELVRYFFDDTSIKREVRSTTDTDDAYPYAYSEEEGTATTVLDNVTAVSFSDSVPVKVAEGSGEQDCRRKLRMTITIGEGSRAVTVDGYLISRSRVKAE